MSLVIQVKWRLYKNIINTIRSPLLFVHLAIHHSVSAPKLNIKLKTFKNPTKANIDYHNGDCCVFI